MNFVAELKRRNVIRVALAYAVVAWFIVLAADVLLIRVITDLFDEMERVTEAGGKP